MNTDHLQSMFTYSFSFNRTVLMVERVELASTLPMPKTNVMIMRTCFHSIGKVMQMIADSCQSSYDPSMILWKSCSLSRMDFACAILGVKIGPTVLLFSSTHFSTQSEKHPVWLSLTCVSHLKAQHEKSSVANMNAPSPRTWLETLEILAKTMENNSLYCLENNRLWCVLHKDSNQAHVPALLFSAK